MQEQIDACRPRAEEVEAEEEKVESDPPSETDMEDESGGGGMILGGSGPAGATAVAAAGMAAGAAAAGVARPFPPCSPEPKAAAMVPDGVEEVAPLTAVAVAKKWTRWGDYVLGGESEAACLTRIDILLSALGAAFEVSRFRPGGMYERVSRMALEGITAMLGAVVTDEVAVTPQIVAVLGAFGKVLTVLQRAESHSAESAAALGSAMQEPEEVEPLVARAAAGLPQGLRVARVASDKKARRKAEFCPPRGWRAGADARMQGRPPIKRFRDGAAVHTPGGDGAGPLAKSGNGAVGGPLHRR
jgi:hypothetical protein